MERIDALETELGRAQDCLRNLAAGQPLDEPCTAAAAWASRTGKSWSSWEITEPPAN